MINFEYSSPTRIIFGENSINKLKDQLVKENVKNLLFVYGSGSIKSNGIYDNVINACNELGINLFEESGVRPNPEMQSVYSGINKCKQNNVDFILSAGGGSVADCAKAIGIGAKYEGELWDIYTLKDKAIDSISVGVIITLAATGTETNGNSVISNDSTGEKRSVAYPFSIPKFAIIDPQYTLTVNRHHTIAGGIDIIIHIFEQYFSNTERTETSDYMSVGVIKSVIENINRIIDGKDDYQTRANISWASTVGLNWILGVGKVGDWASHRLSYPVTKEFNITHGYALSTLYYAWLKTAIKYNKDVMKRRLSLLGESLFNIDNWEQVPDKIKELFTKWGAPVSFKDNGIELSDDIINDLADNAIALGNVGTVFKIDIEKAKEIFYLAK